MIPPPPGQSVKAVTGEIIFTQQDNTWAAERVQQKREQLAPDADASSAAQAARAAPAPKAAPNPPPSFRGKLVLEPLDLKRLRKELRAHRKSEQMRKLDCLGYLSSRFDEIVYLEAVQPGALQGVLGYGSPELAAGARDIRLTAQKCPAVLEIAEQGQSYAGPLEGFRPEEQASFRDLAFTKGAAIGIFPVMHKKELRGIWLCFAGDPVVVAPKELKKATRVFADLRF